MLFPIFSLSLDLRERIFAGEFKARWQKVAG